MYDGDLPGLANTIKMLLTNDILGQWDPHGPANWPQNRCSCFLWHRLPNDGDKSSGPECTNIDFHNASSHHTQSALSTPPTPRHSKLNLLIVEPMISNGYGFLGEYDHPDHPRPNPCAGPKIPPPPYLGNPEMKLPWDQDCYPREQKNGGV